MQTSHGSVSTQNTESDQMCAFGNWVLYHGHMDQPSFKTVGNHYDRKAPAMKDKQHNFAYITATSDEWKVFPGS